jgi:hypothetical protein
VQPVKGDETYQSFSDSWNGYDSSDDIKPTEEFANRRVMLKLAWQEVPLV